MKHSYIALPFRNRGHGPHSRQATYLVVANSAHRSAMPVGSVEQYAISSAYIIAHTGWFPILSTTTQILNLSYTFASHSMKASCPIGSTRFTGFIVGIDVWIELQRRARTTASRATHLLFFDPEPTGFDPLQCFDPIPRLGPSFARNICAPPGLSPRISPWHGCSSDPSGDRGRDWSQATRHYSDSCLGFVPLVLIGIPKAS